MNWRVGKAMNSRLQLLLRLGLAMTFGYAAVGKIADPAAFAFAIDNYRLVPWPVAAGLALYLPWLEIAGAAALFWRRTRGGGLAVLTGLSGLFMGVLASAMIRGLDISCGCFGPNGVPGLGWPLARAILLLAVGATLPLAERRAMHSTE